VTVRFDRVVWPVTWRLLVDVEVELTWKKLLAVVEVIDAHVRFSP